MKQGLEKFNDLVSAFEALPSIGKKSAQRLAYDIVINDTFKGLKLSSAIEDAIANIRTCTLCGAMSEHEICELCLDEDRNNEILCLVQSAADIFLIEDSKQFDGKYFVLEDLSLIIIKKLKEFILKNEIKEILFALTPSISNDGFMLYIEEQLKNLELCFSKIAQGVPTGVSLENVDILSLSKAIKAKTKIN